MDVNFGVPLVQRRFLYTTKQVPAITQEHQFRAPHQLSFELETRNPDNRLSCLPALGPLQLLQNYINESGPFLYTQFALRLIHRHNLRVDAKWKKQNLYAEYSLVPLKRRYLLATDVSFTAFDHNFYPAVHMGCNGVYTGVWFTPLNYQQTSYRCPSTGSILHYPSNVETCPLIIGGQQVMDSGVYFMLANSLYWVNGASTRIFTYVYGGWQTCSSRVYHLG
jgi:hypothetical protein